MVGVRKLHISWRICVGSVALLFGAVLSRHLPTSATSSLQCISVSLIFLVVSMVVKGGKSSLLLTILGCLMIGIWRGGIYMSMLSPYEHAYNRRVTMTGVIAVDPERSLQGGIQIRLKEVSLEGASSGGVVWVTSFDGRALKRSDKVTIVGKLTKGFGTIPATMYQAEITEIVREQYADTGRDVRDRFASSVRLGIGEPEASLANGFLVGEQSALPEKLNAELQLLGLTHIVVASGFNLTILVRFARRILSKISRFAALLGAGLLVYAFTHIAGTSPSMSRASIVVSLSLVAWFYGRTIHPVVLLCFSAALTVLINPTYAWGDVGWLLSFGSFIGVLIAAPLIHAYFWHEKPPSFVRQLVIETACAYVLTLPLIIFIFGRYSPISILANTLVLPLISPIMALTFLGGVVGLIMPGIAVAADFPARFLLRYITSVVGYLAAVPSASKEAHMGIVALLGIYLLMAVLLGWIWRSSSYDFRKTNVIE